MHAIGYAKVVGEVVNRRGQVLSQRIVPADNEPDPRKASHHVTRGHDKGQWVLLIVESPEPSNESRGLGERQPRPGLRLTERDVVAFELEAAVNDSVLGGRPYPTFEA